MTVAEHADDEAFRRLNEQIDALADVQLSGIRDYLAKNPKLPTQLASGGQQAALAGAQAIEGMYSREVAAAMARAGLRPDGSAEAMIAAVQCLIASVFELRKLPAEVELAIAEANFKTARLQAEIQIGADTFAARTQAEVARAEQGAIEAETERAISSIRSETRKQTESVLAELKAVENRAAALRADDRHARLDAKEEVSHLYREAYREFERHQARTIYMKATTVRPWRWKRQLPKEPF